DRVVVGSQRSEAMPARTCVGKVREERPVVNPFPIVGRERIRPLSTNDPYASGLHPAAEVGGRRILPAEKDPPPLQVGACFEGPDRSHPSTPPSMMVKIGGCGPSPEGYGPAGFGGVSGLSR